MKKIKQIEIEKYYCEYCGKECNHTEYIVPSFIEIKINSEMIGNKFETLEPKQVDICPTCQNKIAIMLNNIVKENNRKIIRKSEDCDFSR